MRASDPGIDTDIDKPPADIAESLPNTAPKVISPIGRWTYRTRPIVRLDIMNRMVTKGYQKGVYERVTKGTGRKNRGRLNVPRHSRQKRPHSCGRVG